MTKYESNHIQTVSAPGGEFMFEQRNGGFVDNDGKWIVNQLPELYFSPTGCLRQRRAGRFLGVAEDLASALALAAATGPMPDDDRMRL